jgi:hypothetical protein
MRFSILSLVGMLLTGVIAFTGRAEQFQPENRLSGVGVDRESISQLVLERRTELMIESQTFAILRDPRSLAGAERINSAKLQKIFRSAEQRSGVPASMIAAVAYLESWGLPRAESPAGPKGIMQFSEGTARAAGLQIVRRTKYRTYKERQLVRRRRGKPVYKTVRRRVPYTVVVRDDRFNPERAIPAAARYLARLESKYGGRDWAVFAYHCGEGCANQVLSVARDSQVTGMLTVPAVFFSAHPGHNRELYGTLRRHMERDYSPTYWFRIRRAEQLLAMFREDPKEFRKLYNDYRNRLNPSDRAPHRLSVWLKPEDLEFQNCEDLRRYQGTKLMRALDDPDRFGFTLRKAGPGALGERDPENRDYYYLASPAALGTLTYIAYETRRLHDAMNPRGERYVPLEVTALVHPRDYEMQNDPRSEFASHCSGQVFDISVANLPPGQREALEFVLDDLGWHGYLGFLEEHNGGNVIHIGPAPTARDFFARIFQEAMAAAGERISAIPAVLTP